VAFDELDLKRIDSIVGVIAMFSGPVACLIIKNTPGGRPVEAGTTAEPADIA
jgi:hypothetical protein